MGHITRDDKLLQYVIQEKVRGKRSIKGMMIAWLTNIREWFAYSAIQLIRIAMIIANPHSGDHS